MLEGVSNLLRFINKAKSQFLKLARKIIFGKKVKFPVTNKTKTLALAIAILKILFLGMMLGGTKTTIW